MLEPGSPGMRLTISELWNKHHVPPNWKLSAHADAPTLMSGHLRAMPPEVVNAPPFPRGMDRCSMEISTLAYMCFMLDGLVYFCRT